MTDAWRDLAERLGWTTTYDGRHQTKIFVNSEPHQTDEDWVQYMLAGHTMTVSWQHAIATGKTREYIDAVDMVTQSNPAYLAEHCTKLLDAVGYNNE